MGSKSLFVEHPSDKSNRIKASNVNEANSPGRIPAASRTLLPVPIFRSYSRAFVDGLQYSSKRPTADEWETALVKTVDLLQPCANPNCEQKWYPFDNSRAPKCPFCGTPHQGKLPVLNLYSSHAKGKFVPDNHRVMVYSGQSRLSVALEPVHFPQREDIC